MLYEINLMLSHAVTEAGANKILDALCEQVAVCGGVVKKKVLGDLIQLDTPIKKNSMSRYAYIGISMPADKVVELRYYMKVTDGIERELVQVVQTEEAFSPATFPVVSEKDYRKRNLDFWLQNIVCKNPSMLKFFLTPRGKILSRKLINNFVGASCPVLMRQLSGAVKQARYMGWLPLK